MEAGGCSVAESWGVEEVVDQEERGWHGGVPRAKDEARRRRERACLGGPDKS